MSPATFPHVIKLHRSFVGSRCTDDYLERMIDPRLFKLQRYICPVVPVSSVMTAKILVGNDAGIILHVSYE